MLTIGHSNRPLQEFLTLLQVHGVELLVDVRTVPRSRHNPQFNQESLPASLASIRVDYRHMPGLGGLRKPRKDSINTGWRNDSFRGYADYMQSAEFERNLEELQGLERGRRVAIMCAESVPWRCHRGLIADALTARGVPVQHILSAAQPRPHQLTRFARVERRHVTYPPETLELFPQDPPGTG